MCDSSRVNWHNQPLSVRDFIHTTWVYYSALMEPLARLSPFKSDCQSTHFLSHKSILKQVLANLTGDNRNHMRRIHWWLFYVSSLWVESVQPLSCRTDFSFHFFLHPLCFCFWPPWNVLWYLNSPSLLPSDSLTVPSPSSACVRSSMSEYLHHQRQHLVSRLECLFITTPPLLPSLLTHSP